MKWARHNSLAEKTPHAKKNNATEKAYQDSAAISPRCFHHVDDNTKSHFRKNYFVSMIFPLILHH